jgi:hypothetical protein
MRLSKYEPRDFPQLIFSSFASSQKTRAAEQQQTEMSHLATCNRNEIREAQLLTLVFHAGSNPALDPVKLLGVPKENFVLSGL